MTQFLIEEIKFGFFFWTDITVTNRSEYLIIWQSLRAHIACALRQVVDGHNTCACTREGAVTVKQSR